MASQLKDVRRVTIVGAIVNLFLTIIKIVIGLGSNSMSLVADGIHSLSDLATDAAIWIGVHYWSAPPDKTHPYGHGRYETLVNLFIAVYSRICRYWYRMESYFLYFIWDICSYSRVECILCSYCINNYQRDLIQMDIYKRKGNRLICSGN